MKGEDLAKAFGYIDDEYLKLAEDEMVRGKINMDKAGLGKIAQFGMKRKNRIVLKYVAAVMVCFIGTMAILALSNTTMAADWFGLKKVLLKSGTGTAPQVEQHVEVDEYGNEIITTTVTQVEYPLTLISLSGYYDSPEGKASAEWQDFRDSYDQDKQILNANDKTWDAPEEFEEYFVYSDEMVDTLRRITGNYGLKLHHNWRAMYSGEFENFVGGSFLGERCVEPVGYGYDDGTFQFDADYLATGGRKYGYQFRRTIKGYFDEVYLNIGNDEDYEEWAYVTKDGVEVMLGLSEYKGLVYADLEKCVISVNLLSGTADGVTMEDLQLLADAHNLQVLQNNLN